MTPHCGHCATTTPPLLLCTACRHTHYCSTHCQSLARSRHKSVCSPRLLRVPSEASYQATPYNKLSTQQRRQLEEKENQSLEELARRIIEEKIRPTVLREDVVQDLIIWLRGMLLGPALPYNKIKHFQRDLLNDLDFISDTEIYIERHAGCDPSLVERNRNDVEKKRRYPDPEDELGIPESILKTRCGVMIATFIKRKGVIVPDSLQQCAMEEFFNYYRTCLLERQYYNSYTGLSALWGDTTFVKRSEEIVLMALGLSDNSSKVEEKIHKVMVTTSAPPPRHTLIIFSCAMLSCLYFLPSLSMLDEYATIDTFTKSIFQQGFFHITPQTLGLIRISFALLCLLVTQTKIRNGVHLKLTYLAESKLPPGEIQMHGWKTQGFFTAWSWNLLGFSFFLSGLIPLLVVYDRGHVLTNHPWILRLALISFEIAAPCALFISFIVTYSLWPTAYRTHGPSGTTGLKSWVSLFQHDANTLMVLVEICLLGGLPVKLSHAPFAPLYAGMYQIFMWCMAPYWVRDHGPVFLYFFVDTTLGKKTTYFMMGLLTVILMSFLFFALLEMGVSMIEHSEHGVVANLCCVVVISYLLMKFND